MPGIFNRSIFNDAIFNTAQVVVEGGGGGWIHEYRGSYRERIRAERERLGIIPKAVEQAIAKVVRRDEPGRASEIALHRELDRLRLAYKAKYTEILRLELEARCRSDDDEEALLLLIH